MGFPMLGLIPFFPLETTIAKPDTLSKAEESFDNYGTPTIDSFNFKEFCSWFRGEDLSRFLG